MSVFKGLHIYTLMLQVLVERYLENIIMLLMYVLSEPVYEINTHKTQSASKILVGFTILKSLPLYQLRFLSPDYSDHGYPAVCHLKSRRSKAPSYIL